MVARRKSSDIEDLISMAGKSPWWVSAVLAVMFYCYGHLWMIDYHVASYYGK